MAHGSVTHAVCNVAEELMLQRMTGVRLRDLDRANLGELNRHLRAFERLLTRERNKGIARHWSYDLNRHIVMKTVRDMIARRIDERRRLRCAR